MKQIKRFKHPRLALCRECTGIGSISSYDRVKDETETKMCTVCEGSGRVVVSGVIDMTIKPYKEGMKV